MPQWTEGGMMCRDAAVRVIVGCAIIHGGWALSALAQPVSEWKPGFAGSEGSRFWRAPVSDR